MVRALFPCGALRTEQSVTVGEQKLNSQALLLYLKSQADFPKERHCQLPSRGPSFSGEHSCPASRPEGSPLPDSWPPTRLHRQGNRRPSAVGGDGRRGLLGFQQETTLGNDFSWPPHGSQPTPTKCLSAESSQGLRPRDQHFRYSLPRDKLSPDPSLSKESGSSVWAWHPRLSRVRPVLTFPPLPRYLVHAPSCFQGYIFLCSGNIVCYTHRALSCWAQLLGEQGRVISTDILFSG